MELLDNEVVTLNVSVDVQRVTGFLMKVSDSLEDDNQLNRFALITKTKLGSKKDEAKTCLESFSRIILQFFLQTSGPKFCHLKSFLALSSQSKVTPKLTGQLLATLSQKEPPKICYLFSKITIFGDHTNINFVIQNLDYILPEHYWAI